MEWFYRVSFFYLVYATRDHLTYTQHKNLHFSNTNKPPFEHIPNPYEVLTVRLGLMRCSSPGYYDTQEYPMNQKMSICRTHCLDFFRRYRALTNDAIGTGNSGRVVSLRPAEPQRHNIQGARSDDDKGPSPQSTRT